MTNSIADIRNANVLLVTGSNTTEAHPVIGLEMKAAIRKNGAKLILIDPREIELAAFAALHLRQRPGTDVAIFNALAHYIIQQNLHNSVFIAARTEQFEAFAASLADCTPAWAAEISGVPVELIEQAAHLYATAPNATIFWAMGITQSSHGVDNVQALANLALLTGNFGRPGTGLNPLRGQNNVQGACDVGGLPNVFAGYQAVTDAAARAKFEQAWQCAPLPEKPGQTITDMLQSVLEGRIKALFIMGENPLLSDPNLHHVEAAFAALEFLVVQDLFLNETAQHADVVLPGASFAEKSGTFTNTERRVQLIRPALPCLEAAKPDWEILCALGHKLSASLPVPIRTHPVVRPATDWAYESSAEVWDEIAALTPALAGISHQRLRAGGLQWPCPTPDHPGTPILHTTKFTRGLGRFTPLTYRPPVEPPDSEYPFLLSTGRVLEHWHGGTLSRRSGGLATLVPEGEIELHPDDGAAHGLQTGDQVRVTSRRGSVVGCVRLTPRSQRGMVFMTFHFAETPANVLTGDAVDPVAKIPEYKVSAVKLERLHTE